jgi:hypothetical protein
VSCQLPPCTFPSYGSQGRRGYPLPLSPGHAQASRLHAARNNICSKPHVDPDTMQSCRANSHQLGDVSSSNLLARLRETRAVPYIINDAISTSLNLTQGTFPLFHLLTFIFIPDALLSANWSLSHLIIQPLRPCMRALPCINTAPPASVTRDAAVAEQKMAHAATEPLITTARYHTLLSCYECTDGVIFHAG